MNKKILKFFLLPLALQQFCYAQNLVQDSSFENGSGFTAQGWYSWVANGPTPTPSWIPIDSIVSAGMEWDSIQDAPTNGGIWSLQLWATGNGGNFIDASYFITSQQGTLVYTLSVWAKAMIPAFPPTNQPTSHISIQKGPFTDFPDYTNYPFSDSLDNKTLYLDTVQQWKQYVLTDTITVVSSDTVLITLFAEEIGINSEIYSFDLVQLTASPLTSTQNTLHTQQEVLKIYPNPFSKKISIEFENKKQDRIQLTLFTLTGQTIKKSETNEKCFLIERGELADGMYFYQVINCKNRKLLKQGKLVVQ